MDLSQTILVIDLQTLLAFLAGALFCRICRRGGARCSKEEWWEDEHPNQHKAAAVTGSPPPKPRRQFPRGAEMQVQKVPPGGVAPKSKPK